MNRVFIFMILCSVACSQDMEVQVRVVDENGSPIPDAVVGMGWISERAGGTGWGSGAGSGVEIKVDENGFARGRTPRFPSIRVRAEGFYNNSVPGEDKKLVAAIQGKLPLTITLDKIERPSQMYVRKFNRPTPVIGKSFYIDLVSGDYLPPYGSGLRNDVEVLVNQRGEGENFDRDVAIKFQESCGVVSYVLRKYGIGSKLRSPHEAPENGYVANLSWGEFMHASPAVLREFAKDPEYIPGTRNPKFITERFFGSDLDCYVFRVLKESKLPVNGWFYGKIYGKIAIRNDVTSFRYYLNPSGERSLEWDMKNNLAPRQSVPIEP